MNVQKQTLADQNKLKNDVESTLVIVYWLGVELKVYTSLFKFKNKYMHMNCATS